MVVVVVVAAVAAAAAAVVIVVVIVVSLAVAVVVVVAVAVAVSHRRRVVVTSIPPPGSPRSPAHPPSLPLARHWVSQHPNEGYQCRKPTSYMNWSKGLHVFKENVDAIRTLPRRVRTAAPHSIVRPPVQAPRRTPTPAGRWATGPIAATACTR